MLSILSRSFTKVETASQIRGESELKEEKRRKKFYYKKGMIFRELNITLRKVVQQMLVVNLIKYW